MKPRAEAERSAAARSQRGSAAPGQLLLVALVAIPIVVALVYFRVDLLGLLIESLFVSIEAPPPSFE